MGKDTLPYLNILDLSESDAGRLVPDQISNPDAVGKCTFPTVPHHPPPLQRSAVTKHRLGG